MSQPQPMIKQHRPVCVACGRELVFAAIVAGCEMFTAWLCDCTQQPEGVVADIVRAREWDEHALVYEVFADESS